MALGLSIDSQNTINNNSRLKEKIDFTIFSLLGAPPTFGALNQKSVPIIFLPLGDVICPYNKYFIPHKLPEEMYSKHLGYLGPWAQIRGRGPKKN